MFFSKGPFIISNINLEIKSKFYSVNNKNSKGNNKLIAYKKMDS